MSSPDSGSAEAAMVTMAAALSRPFWIKDRVVQVGVTAGLAHAPRDATSRDELMRRADLALRAAKKKQRGGVLHFEPAMDVEFDDRRFLEKELRRALDEDAFDGPLPADRFGRRRPHRRRRGAAALDPSGARRDRACDLRAGCRAFRPDAPARRIRAAAGADRCRALARYRDRRQPVADAGARSGAGRHHRRPARRTSACRRRG